MGLKTNDSAVIGAGPSPPDVVECTPVHTLEGVRYSHELIVCALEPLNGMAITAGYLMLVAGVDHRYSAIVAFTQLSPVIDDYSPRASDTPGGGVLTVTVSYVDSFANRGQLSVLLGGAVCAATLSDPFVELRDDGGPCPGAGALCEPRKKQRAVIKFVLLADVASCRVTHDALV